MTRKELRDAIYEELYNELHKKGHKDPKGRKLMKGEEDLEEAINKSDAKYTMRMMFDNHGFGKALKHMKILRKGITLNMSSYMGPGKVLTKIVKDFNEVMGTKFKIDVDSFQKGHVTSIELKEGKLNEKHPVDIVLGGILARREGGIKNYQIITDPISDRQKADLMKRAKKYKNMRAKPNMGGGITIHVKESKLNEAPFGFTGVPFPSETPNEFAYIDFKKHVKKNEKNIKKILKAGGDRKVFTSLEKIWSGWDKKTNKGEYSNIKGNKFGRELALMLRKDGLVFDNSGNKITKIKEALARGLKPLLKLGSTVDWKNFTENALLDLSNKFDKIDDEVAEDVASYLDMAIENMQTGRQGQATKSLKAFNKACKDALAGKPVKSVFESKETNMKLRKIAEATSLWKHFDAKMKLQDTIMDVEDEMRDITNDLKQLHIDMEQEAEPGGGPKATKYGREIEKKEKEYKKKRAEFDKLMKKLDKMEQY